MPGAARLQHVRLGEGRILEAALSPESGGWDLVLALPLTSSMTSLNRGEIILASSGGCRINEGSELERTL